MTEEMIRAMLPPVRTVGREVRCFPELDSTNTYVKEIACGGAPEGVVVIADCQTAGRGRMNRSFQSPRGKGLYLTALLRPELPPERLLPVTALAGVAVCDAVEETCGVRPGLKWPNDPVLSGRKLCGILTELGTDPAGGLFLAVGIGINVGQTAEDFGPELAEVAGSLAMAGYSVSRPALAAALIAALDRLYGDLCRGDLSDCLTAYRRDCVNLGKTVQLLRPDGTRRQAEAIGIDDAFGLTVRYPEGGTETVRTGEVSVRGLYGYVE